MAGPCTDKLRRRPSGPISLPRSSEWGDLPLETATSPPLSMGAVHSLSRCWGHPPAPSPPVGGGGASFVRLLVWPLQHLPSHPRCPAPSSQSQTHLASPPGRPLSARPSLECLRASSPPPFGHRSLNPSLSQQPRLLPHLPDPLHSESRPASLASVGHVHLRRPASLCTSVLSLPSRRPPAVLLGPECDRLPVATGPSFPPRLPPPQHTPPLGPPELLCAPPGG